MADGWVDPGGVAAECGVRRRLPVPPRLADPQGSGSGVSPGATRAGTAPTPGRRRSSAGAGDPGRANPDQGGTAAGVSGAEEGRGRRADALTERERVVSTAAAVAFIAGGFAFGVTFALVAVRFPRRAPTREEQLVRKVYRHLDEIIGATKYENQLRADKRFRVIHKRRWYWWLVPVKVRQGLADYLWPIPRIGPGVNPIPSDRRIAKYVQASADQRTWTIWYTSEAPANHAPFIEWLTKGRPVQGGGLGQAPGREWTPDLFRVERNWAEGLVRLTMAERTELPERLVATKDKI